MIGKEKVKLIDVIYKGPDAAFMYEKSSYGRWVILAVDQGSFQYQVGKEKGKAAFGDLVFCPPGITLHRKAVTPISFYRILFECSQTDAKAAAPLPVGKVTLQNTNRLSSNFAYFRQYYVSGNEKERLYLNHILEDLLFICDSERHKRQIQQDPLILKVIEYLNNHYHEPLQLKDIANEAGLSPSWLSRRFQQCTGQSPSEYLTLLRLNRSQTLLLRTDDTIDAIASECGFQNGFYFSRVFTRKAGMNPSAYRKLYRT